MKLEVYGSGHYMRGGSMIAYAAGAGGRVCDLPGHYLDMIAEAVATCHPEYVKPRVRELLVNGEFRRSTHPELIGVTLAELRRRHSDEYRRTYERRARNPRFHAAERARKSASRSGSGHRSMNMVESS